MLVSDFTRFWTARTVHHELIKAEVSFQIRKLFEAHETQVLWQSETK